ncbi:MAG: LysR family transcriptional regulator [Eubacterium sp.]|nr:LysR family transcriptional regulator [Eubacterium sp.]
MTDTQLKYFITIIELGSFSEAALALDISQSSVSKQIMALEEELDIKLFDRSFRKASLTPAGEHLYQDAVLTLQQISHMKEVARQLSRKGKKRLSLLALPVIGHFNFYIPIQLFESSHRDLDIELEEVEEPEMYRRMNTGDFDASITYYNPEHLIKHARFYPLVEDEMVLVCHNSHPYSSLKKISPQQLDDIPVLSMQKYTCIHQFYELYFRKHHSNPHIIFRGRPESILVGAEARRAPALLTRIHTETMRISNVSLIPFDPPLKSIFGIIVNEHSEHYDLLPELLSLLKENA